MHNDLDNDGYLDIVTTNINQPAFVLINNTPQLGSLTNHFIKLQLRGDSLNTRGFGAKIKLYSNGMLQVEEQNPVRGYFSSVDPDLLFGLEKQTKADSIIITWPDQKIQVLKEIPADTAIGISWKLAAFPSLYKNEKAMLLLSDPSGLVSAVIFFPAYTATPIIILDIA